MHNSERVPLGKKSSLDQDLKDALQWIKQRSAADAMAEREATMRAIEELANEIETKGLKRRWSSAIKDPALKKFADEVNGPLMELLALRARYHDAECVDLFRKGAPIVGKLHRTGNGTPQAQPARKSVNELRQERSKTNAAVIQGLKEDPKWSRHLLKSCLDDHKKGRMAMPRLSHEVILEQVSTTFSHFSRICKMCVCIQVTLSPRFAVEQGVKPDGSTKIRPIDDLTRSGCNAATETTEKLSYESLDLLMTVLRDMEKDMGSDLELWKADIDSAFRRIPVLPEHRQYAHVAFRHDGNVITAQHLGLPFGAVASVHHWERCGELIKAIARRILHLPVLRFVDDFFTADRRESTAHAMHIFARLVRCLLGPTAIAAHKLQHANPLPVLGINVKVSSVGAIFWPEPEKIVKWIAQIEAALKAKRLDGGEASRLAGRLSFGSQHIFRKLGRAMLVPIFKQARSRTNEIDEELEKALRWWLQILQDGICEIRQWRESEKDEIHLLCDARSTPPRIAAVLVADGKMYYADAEPSVTVMKQFKSRRDNQIASLELLSIAFGMSTFAEELTGRNVVVHSDNTIAEHGVRKGRAR